MRKLFRIVLVLFAVALVAGGVLVWRFDLNAYKPEIEKAASDALQQKVVISGPLRLGVAGWQPAVTAQDITLGEKGKGSVIMIGKLDVSLPLRRVGEDEPWAVFATIGRLRFNGKELGDYETPLIFDRNGFDAPEIRGKMGRAGVTARATYLQSRLHVEAKAQKLDYSQLAENDIGGGDVRVELTLDSHGDTADKLTANMSGRFFLAGGAGSMKGRVLDFWGADIFRTVLDLKGDRTKINCAIAHFKIENGVFHSRHVLIDTGEVTVFGDGTIDFAKSAVDMRFTPRPKQRAIVNVATPVNVRGHFGDVRTEPDPAGLARTVGGLVMGAINPAMAAVPYLLQETSSGNACTQYVREKK